MSRSKSTARASTRSSLRMGLTEDESHALNGPEVKSQRTASVYDAVAGRIGTNGLLSEEQLTSSRNLASTAEEVLLRRVNAPDEIPYDFYNADERLKPNQKLADSELLKAIHVYASDFWAAISLNHGRSDFRSFDGSALLALGILLEEATKDALGENGDMALVEPEGLETQLFDSMRTRYQVLGRVKPRRVRIPEPQPMESDEEEVADNPRKRRKAYH